MVWRAPYPTEPCAMALRAYALGTAGLPMRARVPRVCATHHTPASAFQRAASIRRVSHAFHVCATNRQREKRVCAAHPPPCGARVERVCATHHTPASAFQRAAPIRRMSHAFHACAPPSHPRQRVPARRTHPSCGARVPRVCVTITPSHHHTPHSLPLLTSLYPSTSPPASAGFLLICII